MRNAAFLPQREAPRSGDLPGGDTATLAGPREVVVRWLHGWRYWAVLGCCLTTAMILRAGAGATGVHVEGHICRSVLERDGGVRAKETWRFEVDLADAAPEAPWRILTAPALDLKPESLTYDCETWLEGTTLVRRILYHLPDDLWQRTAARLATNKHSAGIGSEKLDIFESDHPQNDQPCSLVLWLAYAAEAFCRDVSSSAITDLLSPDSAANPSRVPTIRLAIEPWTTVAAACPKAIEIHNIGVFDDVRADGKRVQGPHSPPFQDGFLRARLEVQAVTNFNGRLVPSEGSFREFAWQPGATRSDQLWVATLTTFRASVVRPGSWRRTPLRATGRPLTVAEVKDHRVRLASGDPVYYFTTNEVLDPEDPRLAKFRHRNQQLPTMRAAASGKPPTLVRSIAWLVFAALAVVPLAVWHRRRHRFGTHRTSTHYHDTLSGPEADR